jgi:CheY-like chemotaxis protein
MAFIIYAEDDELMGEMVQATLMSAGHAVGVVGDGEDALQVLRRRRPALAIIDMSMPNMTGSELITILRRDPDLYDLPVLVLTGRRGEEDEKIARQAGANEYLRKPFDPDFLISVVDQLLDWAASRQARPSHPQSL